MNKQELAELLIKLGFYAVIVAVAYSVSSNIPGYAIGISIAIIFCVAAYILKR